MLMLSPARILLLASLLDVACSFLTAPIAFSRAPSRLPCLAPGIASMPCLDLKTGKHAVPVRRSPISALKMIEFGGIQWGTPEFATFPQTMFSIVNFVVLPFWGLMIAAPNNELTQKLMKSSVPILLGAAMHLSLVVYGPTADPAGALSELKLLGTQGFEAICWISAKALSAVLFTLCVALSTPLGCAAAGFVQLSAMQQMRQFPDFVSEEWVHVLTWDLFVGRYVYLDGLEKKVPTPHSLFFTFLLGPVWILSVRPPWLHFTLAEVRKCLQRASTSL